MDEEKSFDEYDETDWRKWRGKMKLVYVSVVGREATVEYGGEARRVRMCALLEGPNGWYLECHCHNAGATRTFAVSSIGAVTADDGIRFADFHEWMVHRATISPSVADQMGLRIPAPEERR